MNWLDRFRGRDRIMELEDAVFYLEDLVDQYKQQTASDRKYIVNLRAKLVACKRALDNTRIELNGAEVQIPQPTWHELRKAVDGLRLD